MSVQKKLSDPPRRAPVPCPKLPASFRSSVKEKNANYSYASIEFRPAIVTDDGVTAGPKSDDENDNFNDEMNNEDFQWEDELPLSPVDSEHYAEVEITPRFEHSQSDVPPIIPPRRFNSNENIDDPSFEIYDTPIDNTPDDVDLSQLYAVVDFSKKKKKSKKSSLDSIENVRPDVQLNTDIVYDTPDVEVEQNLQNVPEKNDGSQVGNSKFFVDIPASRAGAPPPVPKPFACKLLCFPFNVVFIEIN